MATVAAVIASTHHPFYYRASTSAGPDRPPFADEWVAKIEAFRQTLTRAEPDVLVMVGSDHFHQLWLDNMPQFLVGKAPFFDANWYNEEREFGLPRMRLAGDEDLAAYLLREGLDAGFDLAFSNELRIDHSITCPIITLRPQADLPIVPIYTNIFAPPLPQPRRFVQLGRAIRQMVESSSRVIVVADSSKFGRSNFVHICDLAEVSTLVTEREPEPVLRDALDAVEVEIVVTASA